MCVYAFSFHRYDNEKIMKRCQSSKFVRVQEGTVQNAMQVPVKIVPPSPVPEQTKGYEQTTRAAPGDRSPGSSQAGKGDIFRF